MKIVLQRVKRASVEVDKRIVANIGKGILLLVGFEKGENPDLEKAAEKCVNLRIFEDEKGKMNRSLLECGYEILVVPNFTLLGDTRKGRRPSFDRAEEPSRANQFFENFVKLLEDKGAKVKRGIFGARMEVHLINDGPVTFILDSF
jgi:D-tyrosyl-tRNA(Tyr) deacylase